MTVRARRRARHSDSGERGAVMIEFALILPFLLLMSFGIVEYAVGFQAAGKTLDASRSGARVGATLGPAPTSDQYVLNAVRSDLASQGLLGQAQRVSIFYMGNSGTTPAPAGCTTDAVPSGTCDVYSGNQLRDLTITYNATTGCPSAALLATWCPSSRIDDQATADYIGVYVETKPSFLTRLFGSSYTVRRTTIMHIEPGDD